MENCVFENTSKNFISFKFDKKIDVSKFRSTN